MQVHKKLNLRSLSANEHPYENSNFVKFIKLDKMHVSPFWLCHQIGESMRWDAVCGQLASHEYGVTSRGGFKKVKVHFSQILSEYETYIPPFWKLYFFIHLNCHQIGRNMRCSLWWISARRAKKWYVGIVSWKDRLVQSNAMQGLGHLTWLKSPVKRSRFFFSMFGDNIGIVSYSMVAVSWKGRWERRREKPLKVFPFSELPRM